MNAIPKFCIIPLQYLQNIINSNSISLSTFFSYPHSQNHILLSLSKPSPLVKVDFDI